MEEQDRLKPMTETAILAAVDTGEYDADSSLDELEELARTAGAEVIGRLVQKRESPDTATSPRPSSAIWRTPCPAGWSTVPS